MVSGYLLSYYVLILAISNSAGLECPTLCTSCSSDTQCSSCKSFASLPVGGGVCLCQSTHKFDSSTGTCAECPENSSQWPGLPDWCQCNTGYTMIFNVCICNSGTYYNAAQGICKSLPANSTRDSSDHSRFTCNNGYYYSSTTSFLPHEQYASRVISFSSQYSSSAWSATQVLGQPNTQSYGDIATSWAPLQSNADGDPEADEFIEVEFATPVYATSIEVRETYGNGFVRKIESISSEGIYYTVWSGIDSSQPGSPVDFKINFDQTSYLVVGAKIHVDIDHNTSAYEEIDSIKLISLIVIVEETCVLCPGLCSTCTSATSCLTCKSNSAVPLEGGVCKCNRNYKYNSNSDSCEACPSNWIQDPTNSAECVCGFGYSIQSGSCQCDPGTYFKASTSTCTALPDNSTRNDNNHAAFTCNAGYYYRAALEDCHNCPAFCTVCNDASYCTECKPQYFLYDSECVSQCSDGYYADATSKKCISCNKDSCISCNYADEYKTLVCTKCGNDTVLIIMNGFSSCMKCSGSSFYKDGRCVDCPNLCIRCSDENSCEECIEHAEVESGKCKCKTGFVEIAEECVGTIKVEIIYIGDNKIQLSFDKPLKNSITIDDIYIHINGVLYSYFILESEYDNENTNQLYIITIEGLNNALTSTITLNFNNREKILGIDSTVLSQDPSSIIIGNNTDTNQNNDQVITQDATQEKDFESIVSQSEYLAQDATAQEVASSGSTATSSVTTIAAAMSFASTAGLWSLVNTLQMLSTLPLLNVELPILVFATHICLRAYNPIPNLMTYFVPEEGPRPFRRASLSGFSTALSLINAGDGITAIGITIATYPILLIIRNFIPQNYKTKFIGNKVNGLIKDYKWNAFTRFYIESYIELAIAAAIQIITIEDITDYDNFNIIFNILIAGIIMVGYI